MRAEHPLAETPLLVALPYAGRVIKFWNRCCNKSVVPEDQAEETNDLIHKEIEEE